jgi:hypothetical protein
MFILLPYKISQAAPSPDPDVKSEFPLTAEINSHTVTAIPS